jgi:acetyltransferase-like isoleucine patch superfamily enzyme
VLGRARRWLRELPWRLAYGKGPWIASALRRRWLVLKHPRAHVAFGPRTYLGPGFSLHIPDRGSFVVGAGVEFRRGFRAEVIDGGRIVIGDDCVFTYDVLMQCSTEIAVEDGCTVGQNTIVLDGQHRYRDPTRNIRDQGIDSRPLRIGSGAMITSKTTIMADVGTRAFIGANAVVTRPAPPYSVVVGAPAKPIDYFGPPELRPDALDPA